MSFDIGQWSYVYLVDIEVIFIKNVSKTPLR